VFIRNNFSAAVSYGLDVASLQRQPSTKGKGTYTPTAVAKAIRKLPPN